MLDVIISLVSYKVLVLTQKQGTHLGVADGKLKLGHRQLRGLAVNVGPVDHPVHQGRGGRLGNPLRGQGRAARHRCSTRWRAVPLRGRPLNGPSLAGATTDAEVRRHLLQDCRPSVPAPAATPAAERVDEEPGGAIVDETYSPKNNFSTIRQNKILIKQNPQVTSADSKETRG